jgi:hypothetical protein
VYWSDVADAVESIGFLPGVNAGVSTDRSPDERHQHEWTDHVQ